MDVFHNVLNLFFHTGYPIGLDLGRLATRTCWGSLLHWKNDISSVCVGAGYLNHKLILNSGQVNLLKVLDSKGTQFEKIFLLTVS